MADEPTTPEAKPEAEPENTVDKTFTQDELNQKIGERLAREREKFGDYDDLKQKASKLDELESANQSEVEKLTGKLTKAEERADSAEGRLVRFRVAAEKKLPADLIDRLQGSSEEELAADADKLLELVKTPDTTPEFDGGARETAPEAKSPEDAHNDFAAQVLLGRTPQ